MGGTASVTRTMTAQERKAAIEKIARQSNLAIDEITQFAKLFDKLDADHSGFVSLSELEMAYGGGVGAASTHQANEEMTAADGCDDGNTDRKLSFEEFVTHRARLLKARKFGLPLKAVQAAHEAYVAMDADGDGRVSAKEFDQKLSPQTNFAEADYDHDNMLTFDELLGSRTNNLKMLCGPKAAMATANATKAAASAPAVAAPSAEAPVAAPLAAPEAAAPPPA